MDPDYEVTELVKKQAKERELKDKSEQSQRIKAIINNEFKKELEMREAQLEQIQSKLEKASKALHLLRYVLVTAYYNRSDLQLQQSEEELSMTDAQNRIHPTVKKLLAGNTSMRLDFNRRKSSRKGRGPSNVVIQESHDETLKVAIKTEEISVDEEVPSVPAAVAAGNLVPVRNRQMVKRRVVIGNISKWMPSESAEDNSTHKWMVYVRGPKDNPNINDFVQKVVFYLHPSYQPNDVIELKDPPFHLSRRGWGEFPLRVQLYFHHTLNKPVDIIHNLKLDRTYTGRQTLGNETVADLTIYSDTVPTEQIKIEKIEPVIIKTEPVDVTEIEDVGEKEFCHALVDHNYSRRGEAVNALGEISMKQKRPQESLLKSNVDKRMRVDSEEVSDGLVIDYNKFKVAFPAIKFKTITEALPYLLKRLPLISILADILDYKCTYPYVARNFEEYTAWPVEKRLSSEWSRAKRVKNILQTTSLPDRDFWPTKKILAYARAHGFTQLTNYNMFKGQSYEKQFLGGPSGNTPTATTTSVVVKVEELINITENEEVVEEEKMPKINLVQPHLSGPLTFVKQAALDVGVLLKPEEVIPGVMYNAAQRVMLEATMRFAENLIRNAKGLRVFQENYNESTDEISVEDITTVLTNHRPEFKTVNNFNKEIAKY